MNRFAALALACLLIHAISSPVVSQQKDKDDPLLQIQQATNNLNRGQTYKLEYKFKPGQIMRYQSEHVLTKTTSMASFTDKLSSRSQNVKVYRVNDVDSLGQITFVHITEKTKTETRLNDKDPVIFDSESKEEPPADYRRAVLYTYRVKSTGEIIERKSHFPDWDLRTGKAIVPFPKDAIPVGFSWYVHDVVTAKRASMRVQKINLRLRYRLESVTDGIAKISLKTEILTPMTPKLRSQILQELIEGERYFDIPNGRFVKSEIRWNHKVQGYEGKDSLTEYLGRYSESLVKQTEKKNTGATFAVAKELVIKTMDGPAIMRRPK